MPVAYSSPAGSHPVSGFRSLSRALGMVAAAGVALANPEDRPGPDEAGEGAGERPTIVEYDGESDPNTPHPPAPRADQVELLTALGRRSAAEPENGVFALQVAALALWVDEPEQYEQTSERMLKWALAKDSLGGGARAVAKICSLRPCPDAESRKRAVALAKAGVEASGDSGLYLAWGNLSLGMAEFQAGNDRAAHAALTSAIRDPEAASPFVIDTAGFYMAMLFHRNGNPEEAKKWFLEAEARIPVLPAYGMMPPRTRDVHDLLILGLAYRDAGERLGLPLAKAAAGSDEPGMGAADWPGREGWTVRVPARVEGRPAPIFELEEGDEVRLFPNPSSRWNSSPRRLPDTDFRGHRGEQKELTKGGKPFMQLCYRIGDGPLRPVKPGAVITGEGTVYLVPSDVEGGGDTGNNTGGILVKITGKDEVGPTPD